MRERLESIHLRGSLQRDWKRSHADSPPSYAIVVFSKDRPLQLHALLSSYKNLTRTFSPVHVVHFASSPAYALGYEECKRLFAAASWVHFAVQENEDSFKNDLATLVGRIQESRLLFLVDDIVFIRTFDLRDFDAYDLRSHVPSLRLGRNICYSYTTNRPLALPKSLTTSKGWLFWDWRGNDVDWAYPLSVDGHIYLRTQIAAMLKYLSFRSPNTLEAEMQNFRNLFESRQGMSYELPRLVNLPLNRVQSDFDNLHGEVSQQMLLEKWNRGLALDIRSLEQFSTNSVHMDLNVGFVSREKCAEEG